MSGHTLGFYPETRKVVPHCIAQSTIQLQEFERTAEHLMNGYTLKFHAQNHVIQDNKHQQRKVLVSSFHLNGHTLGFHPFTRK